MEKGQEKLVAQVKALEERVAELEQLASSGARILGPVPSLLQRKQNRYHSILWVLANWELIEQFTGWQKSADR